jgi:hypothetical protein
MRSKAPPPMSARGAMQLRRDGAKRSLRIGAAELSKNARKAGMLGRILFRSTARPQRKFMKRSCHYRFGSR